MAISVVQVRHLTGHNVTAVSRAFASSVSVGDLIVVTGAKYAGSGADPFVAGDCTKSAGTATIDTPTLDEVKTAGILHTGIWSCKVTGAGTLTMQVGGAAASSDMNIGILEASGTWDSSRKASSNSGAFSVSGETAASSGNATTSGAGLFVGVLVGDSGDNPFTMTPDGAYTAIGSSTNGTNTVVSYSMYRNSGSGLTDDANWTIGATNAGWAASVVAYKEAGAGANITGTGALTTGPATTSGAGARGHTSTSAAINSSKATASGSGVRGATGTGALTAPHPNTIVSTFGSSKTGTGAVTSSIATASGTGPRGVNDVPGPIDIVANPIAQVAGVGIVGVARTASGALVIGPATVAGQASRGWSGSGVLTAPHPALVSGSAFVGRSISGLGALNSPSGYGVASSTVKGVTGTGAISSSKATITGFGSGVLPSGVGGSFAHTEAVRRATLPAHFRRSRWLR